MITKISMPVYNGRIAPLFDVAGEFQFFSVSCESVDSVDSLDCKKISGAERIYMLKNIGADVVICSAISRYYSENLERSGIDLISGIIGDVKEVILAYLNENLLTERFVMPGCRMGRGKGQSLGCTGNNGTGKGMGCRQFSGQGFGGRRSNGSAADRDKDLLQNYREERKMKIAITSQGENLDSQIDQRFGRAKGFFIYDESGESFYTDNKQNLNAVQGAGIQASKAVIDQGVTVLITGNVGPKAHTTLTSADVEIYIGAKGTVKDAIDDYKNGRLRKADDANVEGHW